MLCASHLDLKTAFDTGKQKTSQFRYVVGTAGEKPSKPKMRLLAANLIKEPIFTDCQVATDYSSLIVTTKKLDLGPPDRKQGKIEVIDPALPAFQGPDNTQQAQEARNRRTIGCELSKTEEFSLTDLVRSLQAVQSGTSFAQSDVVQLLNIIVCENLNSMNDVHLPGTRTFLPPATLTGTLNIHLPSQNPHLPAVSHAHWYTQRSPSPSKLPPFFCQ